MNVGGLNSFFFNFIEEIFFVVVILLISNRLENCKCIWSHILECSIWYSAYFFYWSPKSQWPTILCRKYKIWALDLYSLSGFTTRFNCNRIISFFVCVCKFLYFRKMKWKEYILNALRFDIQLSSTQCGFIATNTKYWYFNAYLI